MVSQLEGGVKIEEGEGGIKTLNVMYICILYMYLYDGCGKDQNRLVVHIA